MGGGKGGKSQTVGYQYFLGLHMALCYGELDEIWQMRIGGRKMYESANDGGPDSNITSNGTYQVTGKLQLFGGEDREGGVGATGKPVRGGQVSGGGFFNILTGQVTGDAGSTGTGGDFTVRLGGENQNPIPYMEDQVGSMPAYRGIAHVAFQSFYIGNNPYVKDIAFRVSRYPRTIPGNTNEKIGNHMNPAHIIYEVLTDPDWGMGYNAGDIDIVNFSAAADTLAAESFGLSLIWSDSQSLEDFLGEILKHINGSLYLDRLTGLFVIRLVRDDYVFANLPIYDNTNIVDMLSFSRKGWGETINEVTVVYTKNSDNEQVPVTVQDLANIQIQGGQVINETVNYPGIPNESLALRVASRDLQTLATPLARVEMTINRTAWDLEVGEVFRLQWPEYGITDVVFRVGTIDYGSIEKGIVRLTAIEDVFALPSSSYGKAQPTGWVQPITPPQDATNSKIFESNYWDLVQEMGESEAADFIAKLPNDGFYLVTAAKPNSAHYNYELVDRPDGSTQEYQAASGREDFAAYCELEFDLETGFDSTFTYVNDSDIIALPLAELVYIGDEICQVYSIDQSLKELRVMRGMLDTIPANHPAGTKVFAYQSFASNGLTQYTEGETVDVKILTRTGEGELDIASATELNHTFTGRAGKPWPPGNLQVEGLPAFQPQGMTGGDFNITWAHRDKTLQTGAFVYQNDPDVGPEAGTTYTLRLYNELGALVRTETGITDNFYDWITELADSGFGGLNSLITVQLESVISGEASEQTHDYDFRRADYGYSYGMFYGGYV